MCVVGRWWGRVVMIVVDICDDVGWVVGMLYCGGLCIKKVGLEGWFCFDVEMVGCLNLCVGVWIVWIVCGFFFFD